MKILQRLLMGLGTVLLLALALQLVAPKAVRAVVSTLVTIANTSSNPVPVQVVKQSTANVVNLVYDPDYLVYDQLLPNGTLVPYSIPAGEQLVITDINWQAVCANDGRGSNCISVAGNGVSLALKFANSSTSSPYAGTFFSQATFTTDNGLLTAGKSETLRTGIATSQLPTPGFLQDCLCGVNILSLNLNGYLVP
jgi:hypothetical protein